MNREWKILSIFVLSGCGTATYGPDFRGAAKVCDDRYGKGTPESEACFRDYRNFNNVKVSLDLSAMSEFCKETYSNPTEQQACIQDLSAILEKALK